MNKALLMVLISFLNTSNTSDISNVNVDDMDYISNKIMLMNNYESVSKTDKKEDTKEVINISDDDFYLLTKLVTGEARGETYEGQVAAAAVVINRVRDSRFPDSVKEVIYQKNAFSVVNDGSINLAPTEGAIKAVKEALYGKDPTSGAIYFWNPDIATCRWIKTLSPYTRIGNHVFAK